MHTETEISAAYAATTSLGSPITRADTDARNLTIEKTKALTDWADWQACSTFEDRDGNSFPLQAVLDIWHASIVYETFDSWFSEEPKAARKAYIAVCRKHGIKHGA
jgi:hypothetical protein